jgi:hypothetical protein
LKHWQNGALTLQIGNRHTPCYKQNELGSMSRYKFSMEIPSKKVLVQKSAQELSEHLSDVKNFEALMPENISKFEIIREDAFVFALKGMPDIALEVKEVIAGSKVVLGAISDKIPFQLTGNITEVTDSSSEAELLFSGDFNPMMAMMVKGPITKFLETLSTNMEQI